MVTKNPLEYQEALLDATELVVSQRGVVGLTLEAVASAAGVSKGGLLHHFPSKDCLIEGVIHRTVDRWRRNLEDALRCEPPGPGRTARALVRLCLADVSTCAQQCRNSSAAMLTVLMQQSDRRTRLHEFYEELTCEVRSEGLPPGLGDVVLACVDGLWLHWMTGLVPTGAADIERLRELLDRLLATSQEEPNLVLTEATSGPSREKPR
jgi:AcrR family transcriptional regulator